MANRTIVTGMEKEQIWSTWAMPTPTWAMPTHLFITREIGDQRGEGNALWK
jgi:hypothetical protein